MLRAKAEKPRVAGKVCEGLRKVCLKSLLVFGRGLGLHSFCTSLLAFTGCCVATRRPRLFLSSKSS